MILHLLDLVEQIKMKMNDEACIIVREWSYNTQLLNKIIGIYDE